MKKIGVPRNVLFGAMTWIVPLCLIFVTTPIVVRGLGQEEYGLYALVQGFLAYTFTFNVGRALIKYISGYNATGEEAKVGDAISATLLVNVVLGLVCAGALALAALLLVPTVLKIPPAQQRHTLQAFFLVSATLFPIMLGYVFSAVPQALQRFDVYALITLGGSVFNSASNVILVLLGFGVISMLVTNLIGVTITTVAFAIYVRRLVPGARLTLRVPRELMIGIVRFTASVAVYQVAGNLLVLFERGWITRTIGTGALTYYVVPMTIGIFIHAFIASLTLMIFPLTSEASALRDVARLTQIYARAVKYICIIVLFICVTVSVCARPLLATWIGPDFAENSAAILVMHTIFFSVLAVSTIHWQIAEGLGRPSLNAVLGLIWLIIAIPLMIGLTPGWGIKGVAIGRLATVLTLPVHWLIAERWALGRNLWGFWGRLVGTLALAGIACGGIQYFLVHQGWSGWKMLAAAVTAGGVAYLACLYFTRFISDDEQNWLRNFVMRAVTP
jgi:O-antigen/teichoic acid export membrane protein